jgi:proteasome lid subunit RPN8/RPN11
MVLLPRAIYQGMLSHCQANYPNEACGVLAANVSGRIVKHWTTRNASDHPEDSCVIDNSELLSIWNEVDTNSWSVFSYYHSHTHSETYPSLRDIDYAQSWPGSYFVILSLQDPDYPDLRAYIIQGDTITEHEILIT